MSFIRVDLTFWTHRKTLRLRSITGNDAFWIPLKLWAYAASNQPDGNFSDYSDEEIALLIGYAGDAQALLRALTDLGFMDSDRTIHDWHDYNGYHHVNRERARLAAAARWKGHKKKEPKKKEKSTEDKIRLEHKHCSIDAQALEIYNAYPVRVGKPDALRAIRRALTKFPYEKMLERTKHYSSIRNGNKDYVPNPSTWFNQERFNDDPETWKPREQGGKPLTQKQRQEQREMELYERDMDEMRKAKAEGKI